MFFDSCAHALGCYHALRVCRVQKKGRELFAAEARSHIACAKRAHDDATDLFQSLIANQVAVCVVDLLEVVKVHHQDAEGARFGFGSRGLAPEFGEEGFTRQ